MKLLFETLKPLVCI